MRIMLAILVAATPLAAIAAKPAAAEDQAETAAGPGDKMICKRFIRTGSLIDGYRACKTKHEWEQEREDRRSLSVSDSCRLRAEGGACD